MLLPAREEGVTAVTQIFTQTPPGSPVFSCQGQCCYSATYFHGKLKIGGPSCYVKSPLEMAIVFKWSLSFLFQNVHVSSIAAICIEPFGAGVHVCKWTLVSVSSLWSSSLGSIGLCNEASPQRQISDLFFHSEPWNTSPGHLKLTRNLEIKWEHHFACRNVQNNEIWMFALGFVWWKRLPAAGAGWAMCLDCKECVCLRKLMVTVRKYQACTCTFDA